MKAKVLLLVLLVMAGSCKTWKKSEKGAVIGAGAGAGVGAVVGKQSGNTIVGAIIGAAVGGTAGALIGNYMDKQAEEMQKDLEGATVERVGEGIKITFDSGLLFDINSSTLTATSQENLSKLSGILKKYDDTEILIEGHTDNTGTDEHNQQLSERRSESVSSYLKQNNVSGSRISSVGYGEKQPVADNTVESGRLQNRRVDVAIFANKKLKRAAEKGEIGAVDN
jgi:outer membrane protein OmpA-like peptidoglycan-associated protein